MQLEEFSIKTTYISDITIDKVNNKIIGKPIYKCRNLMSVDNKIEEIDFDDSTDFHHSLSNDRYYTEGFSDNEYPVNIKHYIIESKTDPNVIHIIEEIDIIFDSENDEDYWDEGDYYVPVDPSLKFGDKNNNILDNESSRNTIQKYILNIIKNNSKLYSEYLDGIKDKDKIVDVILEYYEREYDDNGDEIIDFHFSIIRNISYRKDGSYNIKIKRSKIEEILKNNN